MAMRKARRDRRSGARRRGDTLTVTFEKCSGECKVQVTKILTDLDAIKPDVNPVTPGDIPKEKDAKKAVKDLLAAIKKWGEPVELEPKCKDDCSCTEIDEGDVDWTKKKKHTRKFQNPFDSNKKRFNAEMEIDFKVAIVTKACIEPPDKPIKPL
jgi:hypothetical protein